MNTPIGRYRWTRLPFGIKSAPELYQRTMNEMLEGIDKAYAIMDDILIAGKDTKEHDEVLRQVLTRAQNQNLKLNFDKVKIRKCEVPYVGHLITSRGLKPDPEKVRAVMEMPAPDSKEAVKRFLGFIQYLAKFLPMLAEEEEPLRELTREDVIFHWDRPQMKAFQQLKRLCCTAPVLAFYDVSKEVTIQCDASKSAVGTVLLQEGRPVAYASRKLRSSECNWAPIEKEMLAIVYSTEKFREYIIGKETTVQTDHKPLQTICRKPLMSAPLRLQTMLLKLKGYDLKVEYLPGKRQFIADALSRASLDEAPPDGEQFQVNMVDRISVSEAKYTDFQLKTANEFHELYAMIQAGWPGTKQEVPHSIRPYWDARDELSTLDGIIYKGMKITVPPSMRGDMLRLIHETHLGIVKSKQRARDSLYWPGMSSQVEEMISSCTECQSYGSDQVKQPLLPIPIPTLPWMQVASDIFHYEGNNYILSVDYYSKYIEVSRLEDLSCQKTVEALKEHFSRQGIPEKLITDNGPQYSSIEFAQFAQQYNFEHTTSSPRYPQANGEAEAAVKTIKMMWRKSKDRHRAMLNYRATPIPDIGLSPSQLNMSRRLRTTLPTARALLKPTICDANYVDTRVQLTKKRQKYYYDRISKDLPALKAGETVRIRPGAGSKVWRPAVVVGQHQNPRSYLVNTGTQILRRNRVAIRRAAPTGLEKSPEPQRGQDETEKAVRSPVEPRPKPSLVLGTTRPETSSSTASTIKSTPKKSTSLPPTQGDNAPAAYVTRHGRQCKAPEKLNL